MWEGLTSHHCLRFGLQWRWIGLLGGALHFWKRCAMRASALTGQKKGSELTLWVTCSPRTAFFWSWKERLPSARRGRSFLSFKGAHVAFTTMRFLHENKMDSKVKAWDRESLSSERVHSTGRSTQW